MIDLQLDDFKTDENAAMVLLVDDQAMIGEDFLYVFKDGPERPPRSSHSAGSSLRAFGARSADAAGREEGAARTLTTPITSRSAGPNSWWLAPGRRL